MFTPMPAPDPYEASSNGLGVALLPRWAEAGGDTAMRRRVDDRSVQEELRTEMAQNLRRRGGPERLTISRHRADPSLEGRRLDAIAATRGVGDEMTSLEPAATSFNRPAPEHCIGVSHEPTTKGPS